MCVCDCCMTKCVRVYTSHGPMDKASARNCRLDPCRGHIHPHNLSQSKVANEGTCVIYTVTPLLAFTREQVDPSTHFVPELCSFCDRPGRSPRYSNPPPPRGQISKWRLFATVGGELLTTQEHVHMHPRHLLHYFGNA